jgi:hypothetical protein
MILSLLHILTPSLPEVCSSPDHAPHYHILNTWVRGFVFDLALGWLWSKETMDNECSWDKYQMYRNWICGLGVVLTIVMVSIETDICMIIYLSVYIYIYIYIYINRFCEGELGNSGITKFRVTIAVNFRMLTHCMNVSYSVCHERVSSLLWLCIIPILWVLLICWCGRVKYLSCNLTSFMMKWKVYFLLKRGRRKCPYRPVRSNLPFNPVKNLFLDMVNISTS